MAQDDEDDIHGAPGQPRVAWGRRWPRVSPRFGHGVVRVVKQRGRGVGEGREACQGSPPALRGSYRAPSGAVAAACRHPRGSGVIWRHGRRWREVEGGARWAGPR